MYGQNTVFSEFIKTYKKKKNQISQKTGDLKAFSVTFGAFS